MLLFIDGMIMVMFLTASLFFARYWRTSRDRLFAMFALAFFILGINRVFIASMSHAGALSREHHAVLYGVRLAAFLIIFIAIIDKNRKSSASSPHARPPASPPAAPGANG